MADLTIGVEEELMLIDPTTLELSNKTDSFHVEAEKTHGENLKAEFHSACIEIVTDVCADIDQLGSELRKMRRSVLDLATKHDVLIGAAGTHPTTHWKAVNLTVGKRYSQILDRMQDLARANLIYGLHCHVGIEDPEARIHVMNAARYFLPHLLALACSSPFWQGGSTGHRSIRTHIFRRFPRTGVPDYFGSHEEYTRFVNLLVKTGCIDNAKMIYWDIRPHPFYPTVEFRIFDTPSRVDETVAIVSVLQAIVRKLLLLYQNNLGHRLYRRALIAENVYRAARWGLDGSLIDFQKAKEVPTRVAIRELCEFLREDMDALGSLDQLDVIYRILEEGNSAVRQLKRFEESGDMKTVVRGIIDDTKIGLD